MSATKIPYAYVRGAELDPIPQHGSALSGDDTVHQVLTSLRSKLCDNPEARGVIDNMAAQFGILPVDADVAEAVSVRCGYTQASPALALVRR